MLNQYKTVLQEAEAEIIEKKSKFIATVRPVKNEEEASLKKCGRNTGMQPIMFLRIKLEREIKYNDSVMMESLVEQQDFRF